MNNEIKDPFFTRAIEWHVRLQDGDNATWEAFAEWLAQDPRNAPAYDEVEKLDHLIDPLLPALEKQSVQDMDEERRHARRKFGMWIGGAMAASFVAALIFGPKFGTQRYEVATRAGEQRIVRLDAQTRVTLNGNTKVVLDNGDARFAALIYGQALFQVQHDATRPFTLDVGEDQIVDLGTVFDVVRERASVRVAVAQGRVEFNRAGEKIIVDAGQQLSALDGRHAEVSLTSKDAVGAWSQRRLLYADAPLSQVGRDIARVLGISLQVSPDIANRPVYGNLQLTGDFTTDIRRIEIALDVKLEQQGKGWFMRRSHRERR